MRRRGISRYRARRPAFRLFLADAALGPCIRRLVPCRGWRNGIPARWYTLFAREEGERSPHRAQSRHMARSAPRAVRVALRSCFRQSVEGAQSFEQGRRSEERRVGKECCSTCRYRWSADHEKNNNHISRHTPYNYKL